MKNNSSSFIVIAGITILCVFAGVSSINLLEDNTKSNSYFTKTGNEIISKIMETKIENGKLIVKTENNPQKICVKSTKSEPKDNNICWKEIKNNEYSINIISGKKYYIWIMDQNKKISEPEIINS